MKKAVLSFIAIFTIGFGYAQIQLSQPSIPFPKTHTIVSYHTASDTGVAPPTSGANQTWDYSGLKGGVAISESYIPSTYSSFLKFTMVDTGTHQLLSKGISIVTNKVFGEDQNGIYWYGNYTNKQTIHLNKTDSIFIPEQPNPFSSPQSLVALPAAYKSFWNNSFSDSLFFTISIKIAQIKNVPCYGKIYSNTRDSVAGWGTLYLPSPNKKSIGYPVLLVKRKMVTIDSIFVNGVPATNNLLQLAGGGTQGQVTTDYSEYFYTENRFTPIASMDFGPDSKYVTPAGIAYSTDSIKSGINIYQPTISEFNLFPNPASGSTINCRFNKATLAPWTMTVTNILGQTVLAQNIKSSGNINMQIEPGTFKTGGVYFVNIVDENGVLAASGKVNIVK